MTPYQISELVECECVALVGAVVLRDLLEVVVPDMAANFFLVVPTVLLAVLRLPREPLLLQTGRQRRARETQQ